MLNQPEVGMHRAGKALAVVVLSILGVLALAGILLPSLCRSSETANRVKCASNLRQIGQSIQIYAESHGGQYPDSLATLLLTTDLAAECLVCPSSNDEKSPGGTPAEQAANLQSRGHLSYIYLGNALTRTTATSTTPVAYEPLT